mmetsp:Transcript_5228/g.14676  ORF Transcript_5228/g.14676 Transcript_5228/m.14676 type:complete len:224 (+) Transcript_5228:23-694(+)
MLHYISHTSTFNLFLESSRDREKKKLGFLCQPITVTLCLHVHLHQRHRHNIIMPKPQQQKEDRNARLQRVLVKYCPELEGSSYATYPLTADKWMQPNEQFQGQYLFQASPHNVGPKRDHVWGKGPFGIGYYHLLTKQPYTILYTKHMNTAPNTCCTGTSGRQAKDEWDDVRIILFQRMNSTRRNEVVAHSDMMGNASTLAQYHYQFGQNVQLIHGVATPYTGS